ncbi:MAG: Isoaspartyl peptidase [Candidatus Marinimicrobia bacterium]|nr:Isoaspartyl peptidase [Candidatus Neomarinimicrobiota bacterium]
MQFLKHIRRQKVATIFLICIFPLLLIAQDAPQNSGFGLAIHGGAGTILKSKMSAEKEQAYRSALESALEKGYRILEKGGSSLDAVEQVINLLEDDSLFNAGKGAVFTAEGTNELDASIMDGKTLNAGAVAGVKHIKNPISLARLVMEKSPHVMLAQKGAEAFAKRHGVSMVDEDYFYTKRRWESLQRRIEREKQKSGDGSHGTVGCVALDKDGNLAAGTSTGGMTYKRFGRIGDSPIIGAGTYANNKTCAVSATGHGEYFIRNVVTHDISAMMAYKNISLEEVANTVIMEKLVELGGSGGVIAIDAGGNITMPFTTDGMYRGYYLSGASPVVKIFKGE